MAVCYCRRVKAQIGSAVALVAFTSLALFFSWLYLPRLALILASLVQALLWQYGAICRALWYLHFLCLYTRLSASTSAHLLLSRFYASCVLLTIIDFPTD